MLIAKSFQNKFLEQDYHLFEIRIRFVSNVNGYFFNHNIEEYLYIICKFYDARKMFRITCDFELTYDKAWCGIADDELTKIIKREVFDEKKLSSLLTNLSFIKSSINKFVRSEELTLLEGL